MKIKNYEFNGFGFPLIFDELPAVKVRGELVPDVNWSDVASPLIEFLCTENISFTGNHIKFMRMHFDMSLREFATFAGVTHQSVIRWEEKHKAAAFSDENLEYVLKIKILNHLQSKKANIDKVVEMVISNPEPIPARKAIHVPAGIVQQLQ